MDEIEEVPPREPDEVDAALIRALQEDGRASIQDLSAALGVSRDVVSHRLHALVEVEGLRIVAALDPGFAGHDVLVHVRAEVDGPVAPVAAEIAELEAAVFVSISSGPMPVVFESRHFNVAELHALLDEVRRIPAVRRVQVSTYAEVLTGFFVSNRERTIELDKVDYALVRVLQQDGRATFRTLAEAVHLSPSSARARVQRMVEAGAIRISAIRTGALSRSRVGIGCGFTVAGDAAAARRFLVDSPEVSFAARMHGNYDYIFTLLGSSPGELLKKIDELRGLPGVTSVDSWAHFDVVKEDYTRSVGRVVG